MGWGRSVIPALRGVRYKDRESEAGLGYIASLYLKTKQPKQLMNKKKEKKKARERERERRLQFF